VLWGTWIATHFDYLFSHNLVSESEYRFLTEPNGDLIMVWHVRTNVWNRWIRLTAWANQPTVIGGGRYTTPSEKKAMAIVARQYIPGVREFRKIFDDTPGPLSTQMQGIINARLQTLEEWSKMYQPEKAGQ
jgi:hypothetical protein